MYVRACYPGTNSLRQQVENTIEQRCFGYNTCQLVPTVGLLLWHQWRGPLYSCYWTSVSNILCNPHTQSCSMDDKVSLEFDEHGERSWRNSVCRCSVYSAYRKEFRAQSSRSNFRANSKQIRCISTLLFTQYITSRKTWTLTRSFRGAVVGCLLDMAGLARREISQELKPYRIRETMLICDL